MVTRRRKHHLRVIEGGKTDEARAAERLYPVKGRRVKAEPQRPVPPTPPPRAA
jgi:hypothetical protein